MADLVDASASPRSPELSEVPLEGAWLARALRALSQTLLQLVQHGIGADSMPLVQPVLP